MRPKAHKFNDILYFVIPNEKIIPFYMTLHIVLPLTLQGMRIVFIWNVLAIGKLCHDTIQYNRSTFSASLLKRLKSFLNCEVLRISFITSKLTP